MAAKQEQCGEMTPPANVERFERQPAGVAIPKTHSCQMTPSPTQVNARSLLSITRTECPHKNPDENGNCRESQNQDGKVKSFRPFWVHNPLLFLGEAAAPP